MGTLYIQPYSRNLFRSASVSWKSRAAGKGERKDDPDDQVLCCFLLQLSEAVVVASRSVFFMSSAFFFIPICGHHSEIARFIAQACYFTFVDSENRRPSDRDTLPFLPLFSLQVHLHLLLGGKEVLTLVNASPPD